MMPDYVAFSTRVLFDLAGAGVTHEADPKGQLLCL